MDKQGNAYTFLYATVMVVIVATLLAFIANTLREPQKKNEEIAKKIQILQSVNIASDASDAEAKYEQFIGANSYVLNFNGEKQTGDAFKVDLAKELKKKAEERAYPIYECNHPEGKKYIIPVRGKGLWGPIWGFVSMNDDRTTIFGATFGHKAETPGLGAEIDRDWFQQPFRGKPIYDANGVFTSIQVVKPGAGKGTNHEVDAISGGTITSKGLEAMLHDCLLGYDKFLKNK
jgi:Na+-transporting NADH:ubiquinone oxidoreductase subunit C